MVLTTTVNNVPVKEVHECECWAGVGVEVGEAEEAVSWAWELCFSPSLPVNWQSAGGSPSESAQAQSSLLLENTQTASFCFWHTMSEAQHIT